MRPTGADPASHTAAPPAREADEPPLPDEHPPPGGLSLPEDPPPPDKPLPAEPARVPKATLRQLARMAGLSIARRDAALWVTDFLNAAYYRRSPDDRDVDDLRLAFCVLTTYWHRKPRHARLTLADLRAFHAAFGAHRFATDDSARGTLSRTSLLDGACALIGEWFPGAYGDEARRGWGIAFADPEERAAYDPGARMRLAPVGRLTPEQAPPGELVWRIYPPVRVSSAGAVIAALNTPEAWPDFASDIGRFTPLRPGGLYEQTFEIEVAAGTSAGLPVFTRGYVTVTELAIPADPPALEAWVQSLEDGLAASPAGGERAVPAGAEVLVGFDLTTHEGHFMGAGHNRLMLYTHDGGAWLRAVGTWDPMPWQLERAYRLGGQEAQHAFWGADGKVAQSMLHQIALGTSR